MLNFLMTSFFQEYVLILALSAGLVLLIFLSYSRKKKEETFRSELSSQIKPGVKVKTYGGLYGKVISIEETTDGKIVLLESGVGKKVSYQEIHFNAIYGVDVKEPVVLNENGEQIIASSNEQEVDKTPESIIDNSLEEENIAMKEESKNEVLNEKTSKTSKAKEVKTTKSSANKKPAPAKKTTTKE